MGLPVASTFQPHHDQPHDQPHGQSDLLAVAIRADHPQLGSEGIGTRLVAGLAYDGAHISLGAVARVALGTGREVRFDGLHLLDEQCSATGIHEIPVV